MSTKVELHIFSPRWGHEDTYEVELDRDFMEITMQVRKTRAKWVDNLDPEWSGEPLEHIMNNDSIYPPAVTQDLFEHAWKAWRDGDLNDDEVKRELEAVADWINTVTQSKPRSEFWRKYF
ncbi:MAG: hypothetical protein V7718_06475 [Porticoccus sp.]